MEYKDVKTLSNAEISLYKKELENFFETQKTKINALLDEIDKVGKEYNKVENELKIRQNKIF